MGAAEDKIRFSDLAEELGLSGEEADAYVGEHMIRKGYKAITDWMDPDPEPTQTQGGQFFKPKIAGGSTPTKRIPSAPQQRASGQY